MRSLIISGGILRKCRTVCGLVLSIMGELRGRRLSLGVGTIRRRLTSSRMRSEINGIEAGFSLSGWGTALSGSSWVLEVVLDCNIFVFVLFVFFIFIFLSFDGLSGPG
jgi:hypothetical protein